MVTHSRFNRLLGKATVLVSGVTSAKVSDPACSAVILIPSPSHTSRQRPLIQVKVLIISWLRKKAQFVDLGQDAVGRSER
jgi:hypothetical protein